MKQILILIVTALLLVSCTINEETRETSLPSIDEMLSSEEASSEAESSEVSEEDSNSEPEISEPTLPRLITEYEIIENPYSGIGINASNPWDMLIHDGYLYAGAGDYDKNTSPEKAYRYNLETEEWEECGSIPDEQIDRFILIDGEIYIPGTDPTEDWSYGNFYKLENGEFVTYRTIPGGIHCFDLAMLDGKLFASLGVKDGSFPVVVSTDGGETFEQIDFVPDGNAILGDERVYKLFVFKNELYALCGSDVFKYDGGKFVFEASWQNKYVRGYNFYTRIPASAEFNGRFYFTTGFLFYCEEMSDLKYIRGGNSRASDIAVYNDMLYVLRSERQENGEYSISVMRSEDGLTFDPIYEIRYELPAMSFVFDGNDIYIGIGDVNDKANALKGNILKFETEQ